MIASGFRNLNVTAETIQNGLAFWAINYGWFYYWILLGFCGYGWKSPAP